MIKSFIITISIFIGITAIGMTTYYKYKNINLEKINQEQKIIIKKLRYENIKLKQKIYVKEKIQKHKSKKIKIKNKYDWLNKIEENEIKNIVKKRKKRNKNTKIKPSSANYRNIEEKIKPSSTNYRNVKEKNINNKKVYQRFSNNIKLISDSKIRIGSNGKLYSNAYIVGRYYPKNNIVKNISNIKCNLKQNLYKVVDDCSMRISKGNDLVYLEEMNAISIKNFDIKTHMIECDYNKEYGVMHNCQIKIY